MQKYVLTFVSDGYYPELVLLILKDRPSWQKGRFNLPGGKVEEGESPEEASLRELKEETGFDQVSRPEVVGQIVTDNAIIFITWVEVVARQGIYPREGETEIVMWKHWEDVKDDPRLIPNLKVIIPLIQSGIKDFTIGDMVEEDTCVNLNISLKVSY